MDKDYKIIHLFDDYTRFTLIIAEGLINHKNIEVNFNKPIISLGNIVKPALNWLNLKKELIKCDYFFIPNKQHFKIKHIFDFIDKEKLWYKSIVYDFKDSQYIDYDLLDVCALYFKRSVCYKDRSLIKIYSNDKKVYPLNYCALDEYFIENISFKEREIDIGAFFLIPSNSIGLNRRKNLMKILLSLNWDDYNNWIGKPTTDKGMGRGGIFDKRENNAWLDYIKKLNQCKIVFTALPDAHDGDSRTWEALSSGALCFMDKTFIPTRNFRKYSKNVFFYNSKSKKSIKKAVIEAKNILKDDYQQNRINLAKTTFLNTKNYHMAVNRIEYIFEILERLNLSKNNTKKTRRKYFTSKIYIRLHHLRTRKSQNILESVLQKVINLGLVIMRDLSFVQKIESKIRFIFKIW